MPRTLVATDLSAASEEAVRQAHARASATNGALGVCHVVPDMRGVHLLLPAPDEQQLVQNARILQLAGEAVQNSVMSITGRAPGSFEVFVEEGAAYAEIIRCAETWRADLIVIGSHGRTGLARIALGSVADAVVRAAHCSVLVAR